MHTKFAVERILDLLNDSIRKGGIGGSFDSNQFKVTASMLDDDPINTDTPPDGICVSFTLSEGKDNIRASVRAVFAVTDYSPVDYSVVPAFAYSKDVTTHRRRESQAAPEGVKPWKRRPTIKHSSVTANSWDRTPAESILSADILKRCSMLALRIEHILSDTYDEVWERVAPPEPSPTDYTAASLRYCPSYIEDYTVSQLKELLTESECSTTGNKAELYARFISHARENGDTLNVDLYKEWQDSRYQWPKYFKQ